jgi:FkbM family methyltransferase
MIQSLVNVHRADLLPKSHVNYINSIKDINPSVIYDIGSCVLHWHRKAKLVWPHARFICFDALTELSFLYNGIEFENCILSDRDGKEVGFYYSLEYPGGCSYYQENEKINSKASAIYTESHKRMLKTVTLDTIVQSKNYPLPDLIKMDIQGAELDVIKGAPICINHVRDIILELQVVDYNKGAPKAPEVIEYMKSIGFVCVAKQFSKNYADSDYHFKNERLL